MRAGGQGGAHARVTSARGEVSTRTVNSVAAVWYSFSFSEMVEPREEATLVPCRARTSRGYSKTRSGSCCTKTPSFSGLAVTT